MFIIVIHLSWSSKRFKYFMRLEFYCCRYYIYKIIYISTHNLSKVSVQILFLKDFDQWI